jgi:hypothetical protein
MASIRSLKQASGYLVGVLALAATAQAAPEARAKADGPRPTTAESRPSRDVKSKEMGHGKDHKDADKDSDKDRDNEGNREHARLGPKGGPSAMDSASPAPSGSVAPDEHRHHDGQANSGERHERRLARLRELRERYGSDLLKTPPVREELEHHAWRLARLKRMRELATEKKNDKLIAKIDQLEKKENERHEKAMNRFKERGATSAPEGSAVPSPSAVPSSGRSHGHEMGKPASAKPAHEGGQR